MGVGEKTLGFGDAGGGDEDGGGVLGAEEVRYGGAEGGGEGGAEGVVEEDAFGGHADLAALVEALEDDGGEGRGRGRGGREEVRTHVDERPQSTLLGRFLQVRILADDRACFPAQFHQTGFQSSAGCGSDDAADGRAAGEVDLADSGVFDEGGCYFGGVLGSVGEDVETAGWEAGLGEDGSDGPEAFRRELGGFEDGRVAGGKGVGDGAEAEDVGRVPGGRWSVGGD